MKTKKDEMYVALLRGVNVGGNNKLPMKTLSELCGALGCSEIRTYIQSGNVVFRASAKVAAGFADCLKKEIKKQCGFETTVVLRSAAELKKAAENNPFFSPTVEPKFLHVQFLADQPNLTKVVNLSPNCEGEEAFSLRGREIFLFLPNGVGRSKLAAYQFDKVLGTVGTTRNWRTVQQLLALAAP